jgi:hypothetical protein
MELAQGVAGLAPDGAIPDIVKDFLRASHEMFSE